MAELVHNAHKTLEYFLWALSKQIFEDRGVTAFAPCLRDPNLNFALQSGEIKGRIEDLLTNVSTFYKAWGIPWYWTLNPTRDQTAIKKALSACGYTCVETYPTLIAFLDKLPDTKNLNNFTIKEVGEDKLSEWLTPLQAAFATTEKSTQLYQEAHLHALRKHAALRHFVAYVDEKPVSASTLSLSSYGARLDDLGTAPRYQRQGFGSAMTLHQMKIAKTLGYEWVCLDTSRQGVSLYKSLGFQDLYQNALYQKESGT